MQEPSVTADANDFKPHNGMSMTTSSPLVTKGEKSSRVEKFKGEQNTTQLKVPSSPQSPSQSSHAQQLEQVLLQTLKHLTQ